MAGERTRASLIAYLVAEKAVFDWLARAVLVAQGELEAEGYTIIRGQDPVPIGANPFHEDHLDEHYQENHPEDPRPPLPRDGQFGWSFELDSVDDVRELLEILDGD